MVVAMLLSGTIGLVALESGLPVEVIVVLRCFLGAAALAMWVLLQRQWVTLRRQDMLWLVTGGVALVGNWVALFHAYDYVGVAVATVVYHVQPFLLVLAAALTGERMGWQKLPWMLLALAGVVMTSGLGFSATDWEVSQAGWGVMLGLLAASLYTVTVMVTRKVRQIPPAQTAMVQMASGGVVLALWQAPMLLSNWWSAVQVPWLQATACVLVLGCLHTAFMYVLMYGAFQRLSAGAIAILSFIYPGVALLIDLLWFDVRPSHAQWLGMAAIACAVWGYRWQELRMLKK